MLRSRMGLWGRDDGENTQYGSVMSWQEYVRRHAEGRTQVQLALKSETTQTTLSRWLAGHTNPDAENAIRFARAVGDPPVLALVAAGYLTAEEAKVRPIAAPSYDQLTDDELLRILRERLQRGGGEHAGRSGTVSPGGSFDLQRSAARSDPKKKD